MEIEPHLCRQEPLRVRTYVFVGNVIAYCPLSKRGREILSSVAGEKANRLGNHQLPSLPKLAATVTQLKKFVLQGA